jgi:hypothetical protein
MEIETCKKHSPPPDEKLFIVTIFTGFQILLYKRNIPNTEENTFI